MLLLFVAAACTGGPQAPDPEADEGRACGLLTDEEVASFVGEPVHEGSAGKQVEAVNDVCRWGDADPASPGRIVSLRLAPAGSVERPQPAEGDNVYETPSLGEGAIGLQLARGGVRVVFEAAAVLVDLSYDVVPTSSMEGDAIDRLIRLAGRVRDRLATG